MEMTLNTVNLKWMSFYKANAVIEDEEEDLDEFLIK